MNKRNDWWDEFGVLIFAWLCALGAVVVWYVTRHYRA